MDQLFRYITDDGGKIVNSYRYDSFGNILSSTEGIENSFTYTGREWEPALGLYYYRNRWYDPAVGRFISEDPIGFGGGDVNWYAYVGNNPVNGRDPWGLSRAVFNREGGYMDVYPENSSDVQGPPQRFPASNNVQNPNADPLQPEGFGPIPSGTFSVSPFQEKGNDPNSSFGTGFVPVNLPAGPRGTRIGVGIHAGRANRPRGVQSMTQGCIRTTENALDAFRDDPLTSISVLP